MLIMRRLGYIVTPDGEIYSTKSRRTLKGRDNGCGYMKIYTPEGYKYIHRLVAEEFVPNPDPINLNIVNHLNGNTYDNRPENLEWTNHKGNAEHALKNLGTIKTKAIEAVDSSGYGLYFPSIQAAKRSGFNLGNVCKCLSKERKTHRGFEWEYVNSAD